MTFKSLLVLFSQTFFVQVVSAQYIYDAVHAATASNAPLAGPSLTNHGPSLGTYGHSLTNFGPSLGDYGPSATANGLGLGNSALNRLDLTSAAGASGLSNSGFNSDDTNGATSSRSGGMSAAPSYVNEVPMSVEDLFIRADLEGQVPVEPAGISYACGDGGISFGDGGPANPNLTAGGSLELGAARPVPGPNGLGFGPALGLSTSRLGLGTSRLGLSLNSTRLGLGRFGFRAGLRPGALGACNYRG